MAFIGAALAFWSPKYRVVEMAGLMLIAFGTGITPPLTSVSKYAKQILGVREALKDDHQ